MKQFWLSLYIREREKMKIGRLTEFMFRNGMEERHWGWIRRREGREGERKREGEMSWLRTFSFSFSLFPLSAHWSNGSSKRIKYSKFCLHTHTCTYNHTRKKLLYSPFRLLIKENEFSGTLVSKLCCFIKVICKLQCSESFCELVNIFPADGQLPRPREHVQSVHALPWMKSVCCFTVQ